MIIDNLVVVGADVLLIDQGIGKIADFFSRNGIFVVVIFVRSRQFEGLWVCGYVGG